MVDWKYHNCLLTRRNKPHREAAEVVEIQRREGERHIAGGVA